MDQLFDVMWKRSQIFQGFSRGDGVANRESGKPFPKNSSPYGFQDLIMNQQALCSKRTGIGQLIGDCLLYTSPSPRD